ncbi:MAG: hypothetical protein OEZ58_23040, partial [Gammaproteobacteria bacterium]|nr:hypothetical protein [Gammaproteobacteria bacterium]
MKKRICYFHSLIPFIIILSGCGTAITSEPTIVINNDESLLAQRMQRLSLPITVEATNSKARLLASNTTQLTLIAESDPPKYADTTLQATEVRVRGNKAYVSFNIQGEQFLGAVDVYDISDNSSPQLISNAIFPGVDINGLSIDPGGNEIYLAAASDAQELKTPALLRRITLLGGKLTNDYVDVDIDSYAATDVDVAGNHIYITSGADYGKITVLNKNDLSLHYQFDANDARSVDVDAQDVTVFAGTPATLYTFDRNSG